MRIPRFIIDKYVKLSNLHVVRFVHIDTEKSDSYRTHWPFLRDRRIDSYHPITKRYIDEENDVTLADVDNKVVIKNISEDELSNEYQRGYSISSYFKFAGWVNNEEGLTLSLDPTAYVRNSTTGLNDGWNALKNTRSGFGAQPNFYRNISKINDQYACHYHAWGGIARSKPRWNLDLWRPDVGYAAVVRANCNP
jgi:hypothetical protein